MPWYFSCKSLWFCGLVQIHPQDVVVFILNTATESGWLSPWDPPLPWGKVHERTYRPATYPIHFAAYFTRQNHRYAAWAVFFFYGHLSGRRPLHLACARPLCRLKAPLGLLLLRNRGILISEENKKSEPFSYWEKVRIFMVWCDGRDSNPRPTDS